MLKLVFTIFTLSLVYAQLKENDQCGGQWWFGATNCQTGLACYKKDIWYSQCKSSCPAGWDCQTQQVTQPTTTQSNQVTTAGSNSGSKLNANEFPFCTFQFGMNFDANNRDALYSSVDYVTMWIGSPSNFGTDFNPYWHGEMVRKTTAANKFIVYYGYIIAFMARDEWGLKDCDVGTPNLCQKGCNYIRANRDKIVAKYGHYAQKTAEIYGKTKESVWMVEPDFWQYYGDVSHQEGGTLSGTYMRQLFDDIAKAVKVHMPKAKFSFDISAWIGEQGMRTWWGFFASSPHIDFLHTSGGQSRGDLQNIKPNELRWSFVSTLTGKKIIADTGYGVAGAGQGHNYQYDDFNNLKNRIADGVMGVTQANPRGDWGNTIRDLKNRLPKFC